MFLTVILKLLMGNKGQYIAVRRMSHWKWQDVTTIFFMLSLTVNYFVIACDRSARVLCYKICSPRDLCLVVKGYLKTERHMTTY